MMSQAMMTNSLSSGFIAPLTILATHYFVKRYRVSTTLYFPIQTLALTLFQCIFNTNLRTYLWIFVEWLKARPFLCVLIGGSLGWLLLRGFITYIKYKTYAQNYLHIHLYSAHDITKIYRYMELNPSVFQLHTKNIHEGIPDLLDINSRDIPSNTLIMREYAWIDDPTGIEFNDTNFKVRGRVYFKKRVIQIQSNTNNNNNNNNQAETRQCRTFYIQLAVEKPNNAKEYFKNIKKWLDECEFIYVRNYKLLMDKGNVRHTTSIMYKGKIKPYQEKYKQFGSSFFHNQKIMLMRRVENMRKKNWYKFEALGQSPTLNLLLYGPPGTGKSTFAYRVARLLDRHIVSIDLRSIDDKYQLYGIMQQAFHTGNSAYPHNTVFVLEEFDIAVKYLYEKDKTRKKMLNSTLWSMVEYKRRISMLSSSPDKGENENNKENDEKLASASFTQNEFHLKDLLELLQGPVPMEGQIVIATTNHYDKIKKMCPELFRAKRLTPLVFDYFNHQTFNEFISFYFHPKFNMPHFSGLMSISPAQLIELAMDAKNAYPKNIKKAFNHFRASVKNDM